MLRLNVIGMGEDFESVGASHRDKRDAGGLRHPDRQRRRRGNRDHVSNTAPSLVGTLACASAPASLSSALWRQDVARCKVPPLRNDSGGAKRFGDGIDSARSPASICANIAGEVAH